MESKKIEEQKVTPAAAPAAAPEEKKQKKVKQPKQPKEAKKKKEEPKVVKKEKAFPIFRFQRIAKAEANSLSKQPKKEVKFYDKEAHLTRTIQPKTPEPGKRNILVTSALPYCNNLPHLGTLIGCVLSGDAYTRFCRQRGYNTIYICGTDEHGTTTEVKAMEEGTTPELICQKYYKLHKEVYDWFEIDFDNFGRTATSLQHKVTQDIFLKLHKSGYITERPMKQQYCNNCKMALADRFIEGTCPHCKSEGARGDQCDKCERLLDPVELIAPKCKICNNPPVISESKHLYLDLDKIQPKVEAWYRATIEKEKWTHNATTTSNTFLKDGLKSRCITRDIKWGVPVPLPGFENKVFYVWFDAPIGYLSITGAITPEWEKWWKNPENVQLYQFIGKDNILFHSLMFPASLIGTGENYTLVHHLDATEFLNYESMKFSKSRNTGVFGDQVKETGISCEVFRYYLLANRPEQQDANFAWAELADRNNNELLKNLGNFSVRILKFIEGHYGKVVPDYDPTDKGSADAANECLEEFFKELNLYAELLEGVKLREGLKQAMNLSSICNKYMQKWQPWVAAKTNPKFADSAINILLNVFLVVCAALEPFIPTFSAKIYDMINWKRGEREQVLLGYVLDSKDPMKILTIVPAKHTIGEVFPIFRESMGFFFEVSITKNDSHGGRD